jgi:hypothetical protein
MSPLLWRRPPQNKTCSANTKRAAHLKICDSCCKTAKSQVSQSPSLFHGICGRGICVQGYGMSSRKTCLDPYISLGLNSQGRCFGSLHRK